MQKTAKEVKQVTLSPLPRREYSIPEGARR